MDRKNWGFFSLERHVEMAYSHGVENCGEFHDGYMNFGLWEPGTKSYVEAAENLIHRLGSLLGLNGSSRVLDVASGLGVQDIYLWRSFKPALIDAMDVTWEHVLYGRKRAVQARCEEAISFHHGSAAALPFGEGTFTHVMSIDGAEHFDTREKFFAEAFRVLKPGGVMALSDFALKRRPRPWLEKALFETGCRFWQVPRGNLQTLQAYREGLERCGFRNIAIQEMGASSIPGYYSEMRKPKAAVS